MPGARNSCRSCCPPLGFRLGHIGHTRQYDAIIAQFVAKYYLDTRKRVQKKAMLSGDVSAYRCFLGTVET